MPASPEPSFFAAALPFFGGAVAALTINVLARFWQVGIDERRQAFHRACDLIDQFEQQICEFYDADPFLPNDASVRSLLRHMSAVAAQIQIIDNHTYRLKNTTHGKMRELHREAADNPYAVSADEAGEVSDKAINAARTLKTAMLRELYESLRLRSYLPKKQDRWFVPPAP